MTRIVLLNNVDHHRLRIDTRRAPELGDAVMFAPTFPGEFRQLQAHYPIVFHQDAQGRWQPVALFGLARGQNLFLGPDGWEADYVPLAIERQPFLIGPADGQAMLHVDLDSPRIVASGGEAVFKEFGGHTDYLERITALLRTLHEGLQRNADFAALLCAHALLEPFVLEARLSDGQGIRLEGFHTVNEDRLRTLDAAVLAELMSSGALEAVYMLVASSAHFRGLIGRLERRHAAGRA